jgi:hypothetical protein
MTMGRMPGVDDLLDQLLARTTCGPATRRTTSRSCTGAWIVTRPRYPDFVMERNRKTVAIQVGRTTKSGMPVARERRALNDLRGTGEFDHVFFVEYTP